MDKLNLLLVSIAFPPKSDPECLQTSKYFKYLARDKGLNIDVVTSTDKTLFMPVDENLRINSNSYRQMIKVPFFENKYVNFIQRKLNKSGLNYPDSKFGFYKKWKKVIKNISIKPEIIYSRSFPLSSTLMAYFLQKELQVPWVLHLSDPWTISPIHQLGDAQKWNEEMERKCFKSASVITFTSLKTVELYKEKYPNYCDKMQFSPNVFDLEDIKKMRYQFKEKIQVVYTGGLIGERSPDYLFNAIKLLSKKHPEIAADYEFVFAGSLDRRNSTLFQSPPSSVKHLGLLSYEHSLKLQQEADILLVIDTPFKDSKEAIFFPSKLLDYMLIQRRILALTDKDSTTWDVVHDKLGDCCEHQCINQILNVLVNTWKKWKSNKYEHFENKDLNFNYSAELNANKLVKLFKEIKI